MLATIDLLKSMDTDFHTTITNKNVISNIYLYSVSILDKVNHGNLNELLPCKLRIEYFKQFYPSDL